ncbi:MAG: PAS domain S-box protein [Planctomycetota bacterium]
MTDGNGQSIPGGDELLSALLVGLIDAVVVIDVTGTILLASESVRSMFGWKRAELVGENVRVLMPEPHRSQHDGYLQRYRETGRTWILGTVREFDVQKKDGTVVPCELSVSRIDVDGPEGPLFCGTFRDSLERRRARAALARSEARFRAVFEHENELILLLDGSGRIADVNTPTVEWTGIPRDELVGVPLAEARLWGGDGANRRAVAAALARANETGLATTRVAVEVSYESSSHDAAGRRSARPHELSIRLVPKDEDERPHAIVEVRDISDLVAAQRRESSVMRSLARLGEEAAILSHELRSPVSSLELALKAVSRQLGEEESAVIDDLTARMRRLEGLMRRTLTFSRPLDLELEDVPAAQAFGIALEREATALHKAGVRPIVQVEPETPPLRADPRALDDLLANLFRNAAEAQAAGGSLRLTARPIGRGRVQVAVEDEGPGIALSEREDVFRIFKTSKPDGTGLGLALVRKIAEEHEATVELSEGAGGSGLRVVLDWPARTESGGRGLS